MRQHTNLPAVVGFMRNDVAQHFRANRPRLCPAVSVKLLHPSTTTEGFSQWGPPLNNFDDLIILPGCGAVR